MSRHPPQHAALAGFAASMPQPYLAAFDREQQAQHSAIVERRGHQPVYVEAFPGPETESDSCWLCIVADDRPGLLSMIAAVVLANSLDIVGARAYCRARPSAVVEAVDFLQVRPLRGDSSDFDVDPSAIADSIAALLDGRISLEQLSRQASPTSPPSAPERTEPRVYFASQPRDLLCVESRDRRGLLLAITLAMIDERVTILASNVTTAGPLARDDFSLAELDGSPLSNERRLSIVERLRAVVDQ